MTGQYTNTTRRVLQQATIFTLLFITGVQAMAQRRQLYREERDYKAYYFGMSLGYVNTYLHPSKDSSFIASDSILVAEPLASPGFALGLMATARLNNRFELRFNPQLILGVSRQFNYRLGSRQLFEDTVRKEQIQSTLLTFPLQVKFNSDRINNFKVYMMAGVKADLDLASNASAKNAEDKIKLKKSDYGVELGIGFNFFLPFVTVTPEIKFSNGLSNIHSRDAALKYSSNIDKLNSRMIVFSILLEE